MDIVTYARRLESNALVVMILIIVFGCMVAGSTFLFSVGAMADCGNACADSANPYVTVGIGLTIFDVTVASVFVLVCSYIRMRARATIAQFTLRPPVPWPGPPPPPPTAFG